MHTTHYKAGANGNLLPKLRPYTPNNLGILKNVGGQGTEKPQGEHRAKASKSGSLLRVLGAIPRLFFFTPPGSTLWV